MYSRLRFQRRRPFFPRNHRRRFLPRSRQRRRPCRTL
ncbi:ORFL199W.iORF1 [Human betaherpesvirus 5]|nr:ORFL199W.iORF1 [Human betaherpesvirus 5]QHX40548.1 ORFL199W.iORF1 [Human betaherpesvirus 5]